MLKNFTYKNTIWRNNAVYESSNKIWKRKTLNIFYYIGNYNKDFNIDFNADFHVKRTHLSTDYIKDSN